MQSAYVLHTCDSLEHSSMSWHTIPKSLDAVWISYLDNWNIKYASFYRLECTLGVKCEQKSYPWAQRHDSIFSLSEQYMLAGMAEGRLPSWSIKFGLTAKQMWYKIAQVSKIKSIKYKPMYTWTLQIWLTFAVRTVPAESRVTFATERANFVNAQRVLMAVSRLFLAFVYVNTAQLISRISIVFFFKTSKTHTLSCWETKFVFQVVSTLT